MIEAHGAPATSGAGLRLTALYQNAGLCTKEGSRVGIEITR